MKATVVGNGMLPGITSALPLYENKVSAGFPAPGDDVVEQSLNVHDLLVKNAASTFFVRVDGDSMEGAGIFSGDILVVDRSITPSHGAIVVAVIDGGMVVKRIRLTTDGLYLVSEHTAYQPILVSPEAGCFVWGVVTGSVRQF